MTNDKLESASEEQDLLAGADTRAAPACAGGGGGVGLTLDLSEVGDRLLTVVNALFAVLATLGVVTDPTTSGVGDSALALTYDEPKKTN